MNSHLEQQLERFHLAPPSPELRARVLGAAHQEWNKPAPVSAWAPLKRSLLAIAASLVIAAAGSWANHRLVSPMTVAASQAAEEPRWKQVGIAGLPAPLFIPPVHGYASREATTAALQSRQTQMRELMELMPPPPAAPAPNGQTRQFRQNLPCTTSCC
jgi:hypothetical protein